jgi:tetratricopeptide (TPR) repeat protein
LERLVYGGDQLAANRLLKRGAVLHADIAQFALGDLKGAPLVEDGGSKGWRPRTVHWEIGRRLLDGIRPDPSTDEDVFVWYRAVAPHLFSQARLSEVSDHLAKARQLFPERAQFLLDSGYLHESLASPATQAAVQEIRAAGVEIRVGSADEELRSAERFFRQATARSPDNPEAHLRLGQTLAALGRHDEARLELQRALGTVRDRRRAYLAELFLGRTEEALGRPDEARRRFDNAAALYPNAQAPRLALAHLAHRSGDRATAQRQLQLIAPISSDDPEADPWWTFSEPYKADAEEFRVQLRRLAEGP